jgi:hypothetical protein
VCIAVDGRSTQLADRLAAVTGGKSCNSIEQEMRAMVVCASFMKRQSSRTAFANRHHGTPVAIDFTLAALKPSRPMPFRAQLGRAIYLAPAAFARPANAEVSIRSNNAGGR